MGYKNITDAKYGRVVSKFKHVLTHPQRNKETALGNLVADIVKDSLGLDLMMFGAGSIRKTELGPIVTFGKLTECFPYAGAVHQVNVTADQLRKCCFMFLEMKPGLDILNFINFQKE